MFEKENDLRKKEEVKRKEVQAKLDVAEAELERLVRYIDEIINRPEVPLLSLTVSVFYFSPCLSSLSFFPVSVPLYLTVLSFSLFRVSLFPFSRVSAPLLFHFSCKAEFVLQVNQFQSMIEDAEGRVLLWTHKAQRGANAHDYEQPTRVFLLWLSAALLSQKGALT